MNEEEKTTATETAEEVKSEEVKEVDAVESDKTVENDKTEEKKGGFWKDVKKGFGDFWNKSKKFVKDSADTVSDYFSAQQEINALNSIFESEAKKFTDVKTGKTRYALVADDGTLTFRKDGDGTVLNASLRRRQSLRTHRRRQGNRRSLQKDRQLPLPRLLHRHRPPSRITPVRK